MKANQLMMQNMLDVNPRTGLIEINEKRMTLVSSEALGILRRDLVDTLSMERAKGFLMRYGWACGYHGSENLKKVYQWDSLRELLLAGPVLHTMEGVVTVEADEITFNDDSLLFTGFWRNSYEVEEHLNHFGQSNNPVCWTLVGYASGYLTNAFGKEVYCYEEKCVGKGDDHCYFVARTVEPEDEKYEEESRYYQSDSLASELDRSYRRIQKLNENIIAAENVQQRLVHLLLEGKPLSEILKYMSDALNKSIFIERNGECFESHFNNDEDVKAFQHAIDGTYNPQLNKWIEKYPLSSNHAQIGNMYLVSEEESTESEKMIIQRSISICTIQMHHEIQLFQSVVNKKEEFFQEIIKGTLEEKEVYKMAHYFDVDILGKKRVISLKLSDSKKKDVVFEYLIQKFTSQEIFPYKEAIILIIPATQNEVTKYIQSIFQSIKKKFIDMNFYIGIGREVENVEKLRKSYHDAETISSFIKMAYPFEGKIAFYEELEPVLLFLQSSHHEELLEFCHKTIGEIVHYDQDNNSNLLLTLKTYLDHNGNLQKTANDLHLSIAGLRYRIERIESLCKEDLKSGKGKFNCQLAVQVYLALKAIDYE